MAEVAKGKIITLVTLEDRYWTQLGTILNDQETMAALYSHFQTKVWTEQMICERYKKFQEEDLNGTGYHLVALENTTKKVIGSCGFKNIKNGEAEFGIIIHRTFWGTGVTTECFLLALEQGFGKLGLKRIYFNTDEENVRMQGFFKKFGIPKVGTTKNGLHYCVTAAQWHGDES